MKVKAYLKIKRELLGGIYVSTLSVSKNKTSVGSSEIVTLLNFDIPDELFSSPILEANIIVKTPPATAVPTITIEPTALIDWINKK